ncbi:TPA: ead/Ea22-like family protein [Klebsiella variicola subsp. variicola]
MTTDITELAQSLKAAAEKATQGRWEYYPGNTSIEYNVDSMDEDQGSIVYVDSGDFTQAQTDRNGEFIALANPANILALVEALEKSQQVDEELCKLLPPGAEYMDPPDGGDVTPIEGVRRMVADYRQRTAELDAVLEREREKSRRVMSRIAELESHKAALLKFVRDSCYVFDGTDEDISDAYVDAITSGLMPKLESVAACNPPLFWVRVKSDGGYEGPIHDSKLEDVRKNSGEWLPLTLARGVPEREPRTVTVKLPQAVSAGGQGYQEQVERILTAAGIKVEAE